MVTVCVCDFPTDTFPNGTEAGFADIEPALTAFAATAICSWERPVMFVRKVIFPAGAPLAFGVQATVTSALCPAGSVRGRAGDES